MAKIKNTGTSLQSKHVRVLQPHKKSIVQDLCQTLTSIMHDSLRAFHCQKKQAALLIKSSHQI